jgi:large subunit ribosomal protein L7Ae
MVKKPGGKKRGLGKKVAAPPPIVQRKQEPKKVKNPLFEKRARNFGIGQDVQPKRDLSRFVKWPRYIRVQRQKQVLQERLKVPPPVNQFKHTADRQTAKQLFRLLDKYKPETRAVKKARLRASGEAKAVKGKGKSDPPAKRASSLKQGVNCVVRMIEKKKAQLVVIAHDVDPLELVLFMPALCRKMGVPYCIIKGKARLGRLVHRKTCSCVALTNVEGGDRSQFTKLLEAIKTNFNERYEEERRHWGGGILGSKSAARLAKIEKAKVREAAQKVGG